MNKIARTAFGVLLLAFELNKCFSQSISKWNAQWISHPAVQPQQAAVILFRKTIALDVKPSTWAIHISADNHYRLFINGHYITRGPARGDLSHWFYETVNIAPHLQAGNNVIAVEVVNWGPKRSFTMFSQMTGVWIQGDTENEQAINTTGKGWKCYHNTAQHIVPVDWIFDKSSIAFGLYVGNPTDSVEGNKYPWGWQQPNFNDSSWSPVQTNGTGGGRETQHAGGVLYSNGKLLIPRRTGLLNEAKETLGKVVKAEGMVVPENFPEAGNPLLIRAYSHIKLWIDRQHLTMGYPELIVSGGNGATIQVRYAETLFITNRTKGNRNDTAGKKFIGLKDVFIPDGGQNRTFQPLYIKAFRFIQLEIVTGKNPLTIENYYNLKCTAPISMQAKFETDDKDLNTIMEMGWRTASLCSQDILLSDAYYEQMQYTGDSRVHNLTLLMLSGDDRLTRNALIQFDQSRIPEGLTFACYPNPFYLIIPSYSLIFVDQVYDYMMWKGDKAFIRQFDLGIGNVLDWFEKRMQPNGLIGKVGWWAALAWPKDYVNGVPPEIEKGGNTLYTLYYAYSLRHASAIYNYIGEKQKAEESMKKAERYAAAAKQLCFDAGKNLFKESPSLNKYSQITNVMGILSEAVKGEAAKTVMKKILTDTSLIGEVDLFLHFYLFEAMNKTGMTESFFNKLSPWKTMIQKGLTTFTEVPLEWGEEEQRSECHPWSTSPNIYFFKTVCGIKPLAPGYNTMAIEPHLGKVKKLHAVLPLSQGNLVMNLAVNNGHLIGDLTIPEGVNAVFRWKGREFKLIPGKNQSVSY